MTTSGTDLMFIESTMPAFDVMIAGASAAGRLAAESVLVPTAFSSAHWSSDDAGVHATWRIGDHRETVDLDIGDDGRLRGVLMQRWGKPGGAPFGRYPFGVAVESEREFGGVTIPTEVRAGWWWHTDKQTEGEFFRAAITHGHGRRSLFATGPVRVSAH